MRATDFSSRDDGALYLSEGGSETEIMFRHGHELREFCAFELIDKPAAVADLKDMYRRYLDIAAEHDFSPVLAGLDYRASPDWGAKVGYSAGALRDIQMRCIGFLRDVSEPYRGQVPEILISGVCGPRGDAYELNETITASSAEEYHAVQFETLKECGVDLVQAMTFNNVPEAIGVSRAAAKAGLPVSVSFTLASDHNLKSGPTLKDAIETTDAEAGDARPNFYGINCSHPDEFEPALDGGDWTGRIRTIRPNSVSMDKLSLCKLGHIEEGNPEELGVQMGNLARRYPNIDIWGGCCGTWDKHLGQIARAVRSARGGTL